MITADINQPNETRRMLKQQEELLSTIFNQTSFGIAIVGLDGKISKVNTAYEKITGYTEQEMISKGLSLFTYAPDTKNVTSLMKEVARQLSDKYVLDRRVICKDGSIKWVHETGSVLRSQKENAILVTIEDITKEKILRKIQERQTRALENLLKQQTTQLLNAKRYNLISNAAGLVGQQLLLKYIFQKESQKNHDEPF